MMYCNCCVNQPHWLESTITMMCSGGISGVTAVVSSVKSPPSTTCYYLAKPQVVECQVLELGWFLLGTPKSASSSC